MSNKLAGDGHAPRKKLYCKRHSSLAERIAYYSAPDPLSGCHIWHGPSKSGGYGCLHYQGRISLAHRLAWALKHGPIPDGMILCHRCDVRRCVNPDHLALGTRAHNNADTKAARIRLGDARAATAQGGPGLTPDRAAIHIFCRGLEMVGEVEIKPVNPDIKKPGPS